jgi:hypothetical protein
MLPNSYRPIVVNDLDHDQVFGIHLNEVNLKPIDKPLSIPSDVS